VKAAVGLLLPWCTWICLAVERPPHPSDYTVDVWEVEDGLPQISVTSIKQMQDGYLWLGTFNGLVRFDGVRFSVFDEGNTPELGSSRIVRLDLDPSGGLWIITEDGALARRWQGSFRAFTARDGLPPAGAAAVVSGPHRRLLLIDRNSGVHWFDGEKWVPDPAMDFLRGRLVSLFTDADETLWIWLRDERRLGRLVDGELELIGQPPQTEDARVRCFGPGREGGLWLVIGYRVYRWLRGQWTTTDWELPPTVGAFTYLLEDRWGNLWLTTYGHGLFRLGPSATVERFTRRGGLSHDTLRALWEDREGSIWIGTDGGGLNRLKPRNVGMYDIQQGLTVDVVMSLADDPQDPDALWLGLNGGGINRWQAGTISSLVVEPDLRTNSFVYGLFPDRRGGLWIGAYDFGILRYQDGALTRVTPDEARFGRPLLAGLEDQAGRIWLAGSFGLAQWRDGRLTDLNAELGWTNVMIRALAEDRTGGLYVGSYGRGLCHYRQGQWKHYSESDGLADNHIAALWVDAEDTLWIGTVNGGLCRFRAGQFAAVSTRDGLPSNTIGALIEDDQGHLWLGSNRGLVRLPLVELHEYLDGRSHTFTSRVFNRSDGLNSVDCGGGAQPACRKGRDGKLWFATAKGLAMVDPNRLSLNPLPPPVVIEEVILDDSTLAICHRRASPDQPHVADTLPDPIRIPPGQHHLEIRYTGLSLLMPEKVRFRYRLEGLDKVWVEAGSRRTASYAYIPPGNYRFSVTACNNDGVWSEEGAALALVVLPYFWETNWFKALVLLGLTGGTGWLARLGFLRRMRRRLERLERRQALEQERTRIARDIHDELGARLTQIGLLAELAKRSFGKPEKMQTYLEQMTRRSRDMTQAMDEVVWAVDPAKDSLEGMMNYLAPLGQELLQGTDIRCRLDLPPVLPSLPISAKARHGILLVIKEALHNCLKHAGATEVWIRGSLEGTILTLRVEDNGSGLNNGIHEVNRAGHGLQNMRQRMHKLGGKLEVASRDNLGTQVQLQIDLSRNA
jgi:ligand-binding sensor domain-containing protein/signal transduction histidine kinase